MVQRSGSRLHVHTALAFVPPPQPLHLNGPRRAHLRVVMRRPWTKVVDVETERKAPAPGLKENDEEEKSGIGTDEAERILCNDLEPFLVSEIVSKYLRFEERDVIDILTKYTETMNCVTFLSVECLLSSSCAIPLSYCSWKITVMNLIKLASLPPILFLFL